MRIIRKEAGNETVAGIIATAIELGFGPPLVPPNNEFFLVSPSRREALSFSRGATPNTVLITGFDQMDPFEVALIQIKGLF